VILGVHAHNITPSEAQAAGIADAQGIFVEQIAAGSLAEQAKILPGDVILALDGKPAVTLEAMRAILQNGAPSNIKVWRHGEAVSLTVSQSL
jgi:S1-C subfamily serine protease